MSAKEAVVEAKPIELKPATLELHGRLVKGIKIDKTGKPEVSPTAFVDNLPEGLNEALIKEYQKYVTTFTAASAKIVGDDGIAAMKKVKDLQNIEVEIPMVGKDMLTHNLLRSKQVNNRLAGDEAQAVKTIYGTLSTQIDIASTNDSGDLGKVKKLIRADALAAFGD